MNNLKQYIQEKLVINKDSKLKRKINVIIEDKTNFSEEDISNIEYFVDNLDITPVCITNQYYNDVDYKMQSTKHYIYVYYYKDYDKIEIRNNFLHNFKTNNRSTSEITLNDILVIRFEYCTDKFSGSILMNVLGWKDTNKTYNSIKDTINELKSIIDKYIIQ